MASHRTNEFIWCLKKCLLEDEYYSERAFEAQEKESENRGHQDEA